MGSVQKATQVIHLMKMRIVMAIVLVMQTMIPVVYVPVVTVAMMLIVTLTVPEIVLV